MTNGRERQVAKKMLLGAVMVAVLGGCASVGEVAEDPDDDYAEHLSRVFATQGQCINGWYAVLSEWTDATGGVQRTIGETRARIAADDRSRLSKVIQSVWRMQRRGKRSDWMHRATLFQSEVSGLVKEVGMPDECRSIIWIKGVLLQTPEFFSEGARDQVLSSAPPEALDHSDRQSSWLFDGLLIGEPR
ncbi:hypothetical protein [Stenotrophomonas sp.]|uniref:hypothetical protein n=1 Tax=Stenotrophomonas sp. TaxID=69392 RepID=UPI00289A5986|nr:hypothetical protein [Stenotrophomonas sp.]